MGMAGGRIVNNERPKQKKQATEKERRVESARSASNDNAYVCMEGLGLIY